MVKTLIRHPQAIAISKGARFTIPSHGWFIPGFPTNIMMNLLGTFRFYGTYIRSHDIFSHMWYPTYMYMIVFVYVIIVCIYIYWYPTYMYMIVYVITIYIVVSHIYVYR